MAARVLTGRQKDVLGFAQQAEAIRVLSERAGGTSFDGSISAMGVALAEGISLAWASAQLRALVDDGLLTRRPAESGAAGRPRFLYRLTDKGRAACSASSAPTA